MRETDDNMTPSGAESPVSTPYTPYMPHTLTIQRPSPRHHSFTSGNLVPLPVIEPALQQEAGGGGGRKLSVISLNLGGRNTNPVEFELKGDKSEIAIEATGILRKAKKALKSPQEGPFQLPPAEAVLVDEILTEIYGGEESEGRAKVRALLRLDTWHQVLTSVRDTIPDFFNVLNLSTLELKRPSVWEDPSSCRAMSTTDDYLNAWRVWYRGLSRGGKFWQEDAPRQAKEKGMDVPTAFAGLLIFDLMSMCTARCAVSGVGGEEDEIAEEGREVPFRALARFAGRLPLTNLWSRHEVAANFISGSHVVLAQEADKFAEHVSVVEDFMSPFYASDGSTAVFLRKGSFEQATDISTEVAQRMQKLADANADQDSKKAWRAMADSLAAVHCESHPNMGGHRACLVSLHCPKSTSTVDFIEALRDVLADFDADLHAIGMDANCTGQEVDGFRRKLWKSGFELGCQPKQQQVTVAKERSALQTQVKKRGEIEIAQRDFIVSWTSSRVHRGPTGYTPDLRTAYGVEQETKQCIRLPTTRWPFDHCGVATSFSPGFRCKEKLKCSMSTFCSGVLGVFLLCTLLLPLASPERAGVYGEPGTWYFAQKKTVGRWGICEGAAPCQSGWVENGGSCYKKTPKKMPHHVGNKWCKKKNATLVTIGSEAENQFLLESLCPAGQFCYIGLQGIYGEDRQWWASKEELNFTRLVTEQSLPLPLYPLSRRQGTLGAMISNLPNELLGADVKFITPFGRGGSLDIKRLHYVFPPAAMAVSGILLMLPRPESQSFATWVLRMAFFANTVIWLLKVYQTAFADDFAWYIFSFQARKFVDAILRSGTSMFTMSMVVRRMSTLYAAKAIKSMFAALLVLMVLFLINYGLFVDNTASLNFSWPVLFQATVMGLFVLLFLVLSVKICADLYKTWAFLHKEATTGLSSQGGTSLTTTVRTAKLHFISVLLSTTTGLVHWGVYATILIWGTTGLKMWVRMYTMHFLSQAVDSVTNDLCVHLLAVMNMDGAVVRAKGITAEVAARAAQEVEQHRLAVRMLKAAPTSPQQKQQIAALEGKARKAIDTEEEKPSFLILQSAVRVETARIHRLMQCVRMRAMTMPLRYQYLIDVPIREAAPRQQVPEAFLAAGEGSEAVAAAYFDWLYAEAAGAQQVFFNQIQQLLANFNSTPWSTDLGLVQEEFPWTIWAGGPKKSKMRRPRKGEGISPGDIMMHSAPGTCMLGGGTKSLCFVWEETSSDTVRIHRSGMGAPEEVPRDQLRCCNGGAVFVPGPQKKKQRCWDKIKADYEGEVAWPPAASLVDISRCMILLDDPYAIAVLVAYICKTMKVLRLKNRFSEDALEAPSPEDLQSMFSAAASSSSSASGADHAGSETQTTTASYYSGSYQYRDIALNVEVPNPNGVPIVCEIQVSLSNLAVLKAADQKLYTVRRMKSPSELSKSFVFAEPC